ncbi:UNVERIFIED_CONTAM: hypothetical protein GTU68_024430 [Idotea baltica]|nr:hypothetical protein [Idotea baltica]
MNLEPSKAQELSSKLSDFVKDKKTNTLIAPCFTSLFAVQESTKGNLKLGAQNAHWEESGAYTGEISCSMLKVSGCEFVIIGHSERRDIFKEDNELVLKRALGVLDNDLELVFCIGETESERDAGDTFKVLEDQLSGLIKNIDKTKLDKLVIAYEPVWAIGTGKVASLDEINETHNFISDLLNKNLIKNTPILYGGSVNPDNFSEILNIDKVSGALVGGASLTFEKFSALIEIAENS